MVLTTNSSLEEMVGYTESVPLTICSHLRISSRCLECETERLRSRVQELENQLEEMTVLAGSRLEAIMDYQDQNADLRRRVG